ncbi:cyclase family protein [Azotosporobacter soli]|uniref:cyclase family protein n=1 Tax=Azotosporobacter soli TaxID=3055040 RepID=UPI0031FE6678
MQLIDLTHLIKSEMPLFPGSPPPEIRQVTSVAREGYRVSTISMNYHIGTHIDAPAHMLEEGATLAEMAIDHFHGRAVVVDVTGCRAQIALQDIEKKAEAIAQAEYLLLKTGWSRHWGSEAYYGDFPCLTVEAAQWLTRFSLKGVGIDAISIDAIDSKTYPIHHILLGAGLLVVENLTRLDAIPAEECQFFALPLRIEGADGSPVRATAGIEE